MHHTLLLQLLLLLSTYLSLATSDTHQSLRRRTTSPTNECFRCTFTEIRTIYDQKLDENTELFACIKDGTRVYTFEVDIDAVDQIPSFTTEICISNGSVDHNSATITLNKGSVIKRIQKERKLEQDFGRQRVLAIRVSSTYDEQATESQQAIAGNLIDVAKQFEEVSHGKLALTPAGVVDMKVDFQIEGSDMMRETIHNLREAAKEQFFSQVQAADHVMYCLPNGSLLGERNTWQAFAAVNHGFSMYQDERCTSFGHVIHEISHAFGFKHSGEGDNPYADESGYMGYSVFQQGGPKKAFNAHKHWTSSWFDDSLKTSVDLSLGSQVLRLESFTKTVSRFGFIQLANVDNFYFQFNRPVGYNIDTPARYQDRIIVVQSESPDSDSLLVANLGEGEKFDSASTTIEVCMMDLDVDEAIVAVYRSGTESPCSDVHDGSQGSRNSFVSPPLVESDNEPAKIFSEKKEYEPDDAKMNFSIRLRGSS